MSSLRLGTALVAGIALLPGCGGKHEAAGHESEAVAPAPAPPTPDTTPNTALRTPAGIALKAGESAVTPAPASK
ncbi:MAG: hypothetical protein ACRD1B_07145 [Thermoanaerobaculia bacterium]